MTRHRRSRLPSTVRFLCKPLILVSLLIILLIFLSAIFAPYLTPYDPTEVSGKARFAPPSVQHPFGADFLGRDILASIVYGARTTLLISISSIAIALVLGTTLGLVAGYYRSKFEALIMRTVDVILCFPPILVAIFVVGFVGSSTLNLIVVIGLLYVPRFTRIAYASTLSTREAVFVESARSIGAGSVRIIARHILPNILAPLFVQFSLGLGQVILTESGLSFLGLGPPPPTPSWGRLINQSRRFMALNYFGVVWPSVAISLTVIAFNVLGDALRDRLDPRLRGQL